ncbi:MAG: hypothetical protein KBB57_16520 [Amaricoccus sp.]|nr:hypothetical protein [Amaricoccus sp.]
MVVVIPASSLVTGSTGARRPPPARARLHTRSGREKRVRSGDRVTARPPPSRARERRRGTSGQSQGRLEKLLPISTKTAFEVASSGSRS